MSDSGQRLREMSYPSGKKSTDHTVTSTSLLLFLYFYLMLYRGALKSNVFQFYSAATFFQMS
jgi:hypothetical protein